MPEAGDLIWIWPDFDPTRGREQAGRRPALVISSAAFTENTGFTLVWPPVAGEALTSHPRSIDGPARPVRYAGAPVPPQTALLVRAKRDAFITI